MRERLMQRLRAEDGMTLTEVLVAMSIMTVVAIATFGLVDVVMKKYGDIASRVDTTQRGRSAMDQMTRQLRSQVCAFRADKTTDNATMTTARSVEAATPTSVSFFVDLGDEALTAGVMPPPELHTLTWVKNATDPYKNVVTGTVTEYVTKGKWGVNNKVSYTYTGAVTTSRQLLTNVAPEYFADGAAKTKPVIFRFYKFNAPTGTNPPAPQPIVELGTTYAALSAADLESVARINLNYRVMPTNGSETAGVWSELDNDIYVRTADPNSPTPKPTCLTY